MKSAYAVTCPECGYFRPPERRASARITRLVHEKTTGHLAETRRTVAPPVEADGRPEILRRVPSAA